MCIDICLGIVFGHTVGMDSYAVVLIMPLCYFKENRTNKNHTTFNV